MTISNIFKFTDPREELQKKRFLEMFPASDFMQKSQAEGEKYKIFYWPQPIDEQEMAFEHQRKLNPSTYYTKIDQIYRLLDERDNKEYLIWFGQRFCRSPPPAETLPGREHSLTNYYGFHFKPIVKVDGFDYYQNPVNPQLENIEIVYDIPWSETAFNNLVNAKDSKFDGYLLYVGKASAYANHISPMEISRIKNKKDFVKSSWKDLHEFGKSKFDTLEEFVRTKEISRKERDASLAVASSASSTPPQPQPQQK